MTNFVAPQRTEAPHAHVTITGIDIPNLKAQAVDTRSKGLFTIDLSITVAGQTIVWPRIGEEWYLSKINDTWTLDKKAGFGNEGFTKEASPGDIVTVTDGNHLIEANSAAITTTAGTTINGGSTFDTLTATSGASISGSLFVDTVNASVQVNSGGLFAFHNDLNAIYSNGGGNFQGDVYARNMQALGNILVVGDMQGDDLLVVGNTQSDTMHCIHLFTTGPVKCYGEMDVYDNLHASGWIQSDTTVYCNSIQCSSTLTSGPINIYGDIWCNGNTQSQTMHCIGTFTVAGIEAYGQVNAYNGFYAASLSAVSAAIGGVGIANGGINSGFTNAGVLSYTALVPPPSERWMKDHVSRIDNGLDVIRRLEPALWYWSEQPSSIGDDIDVELEPDDSLHAGVYVDEMADVAPELIINRSDSENDRSYEDRGLMAYMVSAIQTLADQNEKLTARLEVLERKVANVV